MHTRAVLRTESMLVGICSPCRSTTGPTAARTKRGGVPQRYVAMKCCHELHAALATVNSAVNIFGRCASHAYVERRACTASGTAPVAGSGRSRTTNSSTSVARPSLVGHTERLLLSDPRRRRTCPRWAAPPPAPRHRHRQRRSQRPAPCAPA